MRNRTRILAGLLGAVTAVAVFASACGGDDGKGTPATGTGSTPATAASATAAQPAQDLTKFTNPQLLLESQALAAKLSDASIVIVDLRSKENYDKGHVPGAVWYDPSKLKDPDDKLYVIRDTLFAENVGALGIDGTKPIVSYDDGNGLSATRFWWVMWYYGFEKGAVLNGGWAKWAKESLPSSTEAAKVAKVAFKAQVNSQAICALDYVEKKSEEKDPNVVILDVRSAAEFTGADVRAAKGGHVPNAVNLDWTRSLTDAEPKVWKSPADLRKQFADAGVKPGMQVITYCQTGVRAAHSLFTLRLLGYDSVRNFDGSWQEWGNNKNTKVAQ